MSKTQRLALVSRVKGHVSRIRSQQPLLLGGKQASKQNREILCRCFEAWLFLIEDLMLRERLGDEARPDRMSNFANALVEAFDQNVDFVEVLTLLDELYTGLITDVLDSPSAFKQLMEASSPEMLDWRRLLSPINSTLYRFLSETGNAERAHCLQSIAQFLRYPRKLNFESIGLEDVALEEYLETERMLPAVDYCLPFGSDLLNQAGTVTDNPTYNRDDLVTGDIRPLPSEEVADYPDDVIAGLREIIKDWLKDFHIGLLKPNHGSGSVAEGPLTLAQKFDAIAVDSTIKVLLRDNLEPESWREYFPIQPREGLDRCSRTVFVPKTAVKLRTISMEPVVLQYLQQGVMKELYRYIAAHPVLGVAVRLADQTQNQVLALEGSRFHNYGTIDLSKASDTVSWYLVRRVFRSSPHLYRWLLGTRSLYTILPNGKRLRLKKFAPMGSALCFPIECIIFSAIVEYASSKVCKRLHIQKRLWSVYGDDLVVQSECYDEVIKTLISCGFQVNKSKSYNTGNYRESCGKEYYGGYDISPLYYRIPFYNKRVTPSVYGSWCSSANNAWLHRLPLYRWYLIQKVLSVSSKLGPYFTQSPEVSPFLYSPNPTNHRSTIRWNKRYQRDEGRFTVVKSKPRDGELADDTLSYFCKLVEMAWRSETFHYRDDEPPSPYALHGCVEYFSSTTLPLEWRHAVDRRKAIDYDEDGD